MTSWVMLLKSRRFIDKFIGDKVLAVFQTNDNSRGAKTALQAALQIQAAGAAGN